MKGSWDSEADPLTSLRDGEPGPFEAFVRSETRTFLAFFGRLGADPAEAEDLAQEVFLKLFRSAETYQPRERFAAFAFRIARNAWIDRRRRVAAQPVRGGSGGGGGPETETEAVEAPIERAPARDAEPSERAARREEAARLVIALKRLPDHHRLVFELGVMQELPYAEIAEILVVPVGTVKSRMFHAVRKLREALGEEEDA